MYKITRFHLSNSLRLNLVSEDIQMMITTNIGTDDYHTKNLSSGRCQTKRELIISDLSIAFSMSRPLKMKLPEDHVMKINIFCP